MTKRHSLARHAGLSTSEIQMKATGTASDIRILENDGEVARAAANHFVDIAQRSISTLGRFSVVLAGGSTPRRTYELLATEEHRNRIAWPKVHIFFGDERCVPPTDPASNYRMANEAMISLVPIPAHNIHRMVGEGDAVANASLYQSDLQTFFDDAPWPRFDLVLLGMGDDGHTASLFPGTRALRERDAWVVANWVEKLNAYRITLTPPAINHGANVLLLVTGTGKTKSLLQVLRGARDPENLPAQLIQPMDGSLLWLVDKAAAGDL
jgi:6-phosphogluconolactonase